MQRVNQLESWSGFTHGIDSIASNNTGGSAASCFLPHHCCTQLCAGPIKTLIVQVIYLLNSVQTAGGPELLGETRDERANFCSQSS